jgi:hypothetical protein
MATRMVKAISADEFARMMQIARPPVGWSNTIGKSQFCHHDSPGLLTDVV